MKKIYVKMISLLMSLVATFTFASCTGGKIDAAQNTYHENLNSNYDGALDEGVAIDGKLDDAIWQNKNWFTHTYADNLNGNRPVFHCTTYKSELGFYIGAYAEDKNVVYVGDMSQTYNTAVRFYTAALNVGEDFPKDIVGQSYAATKKHRYMVLDVGNHCYTREIPVKTATSYVGELNSKNTTSVTFEVFYPWETLGVDVSLGIPETVYMNPIYSAILEEKVTFTLAEPDPAPVYWVETLYRWDENGYMNVDAAGATVGDAVNGFAKNGNWDTSREAEKIVVSQVKEYQTIWFKEEHATTFKIESQIVPTETYGGEMAGFNIYTSGGISYRICLPTHTLRLGGGNLEVVAIDDDVALNGRYWYQRVLWKDTVSREINPQEGVKITAIKAGNCIYFMINDVYVTKLQSPTLDGALAIAGLWANAVKCTFSNYSYTAMTEAEAASVLASYGYTAA